MDEITVEAKLENMDAVQDFLAGRLAGCPAKARNRINMAVDEIFSNIARHAYPRAAGCATVRVAVGDDVTIEFEDNGIPFDPLSAATPDVALPAEERGIGGLGLFMVRKLMDSMGYRRDGNRNILTIKKKLAEQ